MAAPPGDCRALVVALGVIVVGATYWLHTMSYLDIFWMLGMLGLCVWPIALFLPWMPKGAAVAH